MQVRKIKMGPEDEARLRELIKIHEAKIDSLTDAELAAVEQKNSAQIQRLLDHKANQPAPKNVSQFCLPFKSATMAFLVAAAASLFVQMYVPETIPKRSHVVSKGTGTLSGLSCDAAVVEEDGTTPPYDGTKYLVNAHKKSYLKLYCGIPVYVHLGYMQGETLHLEWSNLSVSATDKLVINEMVRVDFTALVQQKSGLMVLVTEDKLTALDLAAVDRAGLWLDELPVAMRP